MARRILVVEDDRAIRRGIVDALKFEGYCTLEAECGKTGMQMAIEAAYDLMLLDLVLPECHGLEILRDVRDCRPTAPVIILTALGDETDRVKGLRLGADDYVVKPFSVNELLARVWAVLRRTPERPQQMKMVALLGGTADLDRKQVRHNDGCATELSEREAQLLRYLATNAGRPVSREELLQRVWQLDPDGVETRTIDMHIARLREKLRDDSNSRMIVTIRGKGYMFRGGEEPK